MQAGMGYMARNQETRQDITHWHPEAKSVLICGFSYADNSKKEAGPDRGRLSRYSVLADYHDELKKRMLGLLEWFQAASGGGTGRVFIDTSPVLERLYARYAGIGWVGKSTMLIAPKLGSYFFLAGLSLDRELACDEPTPDHCGSCDRCLKACPTEAFPRERVLDANRCIAYFTIEHRGPIPDGFRPGMGNWIMGCDICQEVCPWNRFAVPGSVFKPVLDSSIALEELAELSPAEFKQRFRHTPVERAKYQGLLRNALLAMGNSGDQRFIPSLQKWASDPDPVLSEQAAWSLRTLVDFFPRHA